MTNYYQKEIEAAGEGSGYDFRPNDAAIEILENMLILSLRNKEYHSDQMTVEYAIAAYYAIQKLREAEIKLRKDHWTISKLRREKARLEEEIRELKEIYGENDDGQEYRSA